jgi:hypothetical protein
VEKSWKVVVTWKKEISFEGNIKMDLKFQIRYGNQWRGLVNIAMKI